MKRFGGMIVTLLGVMIWFGSDDQAAASLELTQKQKETYYNQYAAIVKETNREYPEADLTLSPIEDLESSYWVTLDEFGEIVTEMAQMEFVPVGEKPSEEWWSTVSKKKLTATVRDAPVTIEMTGSFSTQLVDTRQLFSKVNDLTSAADDGAWTQLGYTVQRIDGNRTYIIDVGGRYTYKGVSIERNVYAEFYCSPTGTVN